MDAMLSPTTASLGRRGAVHSSAIAASLAVGRHAEALSAVRRARRLPTSVPPSRLALEECEALFGLLRFREGLGVASRALKRRPADPDLAVRLRIVRGHALWLTGQVDAGRREVQRAAGLAREPRTRARAHEVLGLFTWKALEGEEAGSHLGVARRLYGECEDSVGLLRTMETEAGWRRDAGQLDEALALHDQRLERGAATTRLDLRAGAHCDRGELLTLRGRFEEARVELNRAADLYAEVGDPREVTTAGLNRAVLDLMKGDLSGARTALDRARTFLSSDGSDPRSLAEVLLRTADLHLVAGEPEGADAAAAEALALFGLLRDSTGLCRSRFRRTHALLAEKRVAEAAQEARRAVAEAPASRPDIGMLSHLAHGRALLRSRPAAAAVSFDRVLALAADRPGLIQAARLGLALARGATEDDCEVRAALAALESWGDRCLFSHCLADVREILGRVPAVNETRHASLPAATSEMDSGPAVVEVALALAGEGDWPCRWAAAMRAVQPALPWARAVLVSQPGLVLRNDLTQPVKLGANDFARELAERTTVPAIHDLMSDASWRGHPARALHGLAASLVAPLESGGVLCLDLHADQPTPGERALALVTALGRLVSAHAGPESPRPAVPHRFPEIVGRCPAMEALFERMSRVAPSEVPVHIFGETGTGKESVAEALHRHSRRARGPFVAVNASSLSDELFEAEMFGHTRGAFTGAVAERKGHVAEAAGGTLFIDEVADLTPRGQAKLLRLLQQREYRRLGETELRKADVRILTATNTDLEARVAAGLFRQDLMYRLTGLTLRLPPLRERGEDVVLLAHHFLRAAAAREGVPAPKLTAGLAQALRRHTWAGNIRELENEMNRLLVLSAGGPLRVESLSPRIVAAAASRPRSSWREAQAAFAREFLMRVLAEHEGNRARTALAIGLTRQALLGKIRRLGI